jgi:hypothetical protein
MVTELKRSGIALNTAGQSFHGSSCKNLICSNSTHVTGSIIVVFAASWFPMRLDARRLLNGADSQSIVLLPIFLLDFSKNYTWRARLERRAWGTRHSNQIQNSRAKVSNVGPDAHRLSVMVGAELNAVGVADGRGGRKLAPGRF